MQDPPGSNGATPTLSEASENPTVVVEAASQCCKDLDLFVEAPSTVTKLDLTRSKALTQPGKLEASL